MWFPYRAVAARRQDVHVDIHPADRAPALQHRRVVPAYHMHIAVVKGYRIALVGC